jgi:hypothetical protein
MSPLDMFIILLMHANLALASPICHFLGVIGYWYFMTKICKMQGGFESIQEAPSNDGVVWIWDVYNIEGDVFGARAFGSSKGYREYDSPDWFDSLPTEAR